jgi:type IV pilus assembly protein PilF
MHNYAWFVCQMRRFDDAESMFLKALAEPQYREAQRTLLARGVCLVRADRLTQAQDVLSRAYEMDPANPFTGYHLSEVLFMRGEYERADFYLQRVLAQAQSASPRSLWLAVRLAHRRGDDAEVRLWGQRLRERFPQAPEALRFEQGRFDE